MTRIVLFTVALVAFGAIDARAQSIGIFKGYVTGHLGGINGGGLSGSRVTPGASVSVNEQDGWGAEFDFGHSSDAPVQGFEFDINTYMINASWIRPTGLVRPFGIGGAGIMQINPCDACVASPRTYDLGLSVGGGAFVAINDWSAVRGDVRYFYSGADHTDLGRPDNFSFWRISIGATFIWDITP